MKANTAAKVKKNQVSLSKENDELSARLDRLNTLLANQMSLPRVFLRGVISGFGSILGATIVMGFVVGFIAWLVVSLVQVPVVGEFFSQENVSEQFNSL